MNRRQTSRTESAAIGLFFRYRCCGWYPGEPASDQPAGIGRASRRLPGHPNPNGRTGSPSGTESTVADNRQLSISSS